MSMLRKDNSSVKKSVTIIAVGLILTLATLVFSHGHSAKSTFIGNLQRMEIIITEGEFVKETDHMHGHYIGRMSIPTKYPFCYPLLGIFIVFLSPLGHRLDFVTDNSNY